MKFREPLTRPDPPVAGVMGWPISQSKSPLIHRFWLGELGMDGDYVRLPVEPDDVVYAIKALPALGFRGVNLTMPHKLAALRAVDEISPEASAVGAINTVSIDAAGKLTGTNTDVAGVLEPLAGLDLTGKAVCIAGAGGAAQAVAVAMRKKGVAEVRLINRSPDRAAEILTRLGLSGLAASWDDAATALDGAALLVNSSSLGMKDQPPLPLDLDGLAADAWVFDIVYTPLETELLKAARTLGLRTVDGLDMLIGQAADAFALFFDAPAPRSPAQEARLRQLLEQGHRPE